MKRISDVDDRHLQMLQMVELQKVEVLTHHMEEKRKKEEEERILCMDLSKLDQEVREFYLKRRREILARYN